LTVIKPKPKLSFFVASTIQAFRQHPAPTVVQKYVSQTEKASIIQVTWKKDSGLTQKLLQNIRKLDGTDSVLSLNVENLSQEYDSL
jgi:hypothetical protein